MDDSIVIFLFIGIGGFVLFWGTVIYLIVRFLRSKSDLTGAQKLNIVAKAFQAFSGRGASGDLMDTRAGSAAASQGIDLNHRH